MPQPDHAAPPAGSAIWPYPLWIAHRGAGTLAPENTLAAFRLGAAHGYRMFECDAKLSADGVPFLLHDATLERTTNAQGDARQLSWSELSRLDAGGWHSPGYAGEPPATLAALVAFCRANGHCLNVEIKPSPGAEAETGTAVARALARQWEDAEFPPPLLSSFSREALAAARDAAPRLPRGLLLHELDPDWADAARHLDCRAIVCHHPLWTADLVAQVHAAGWRALAYTVNDADEAQRLLGLGLDGLITDRVDRLPTGQPGRSGRH
ncbi:MAG: hypothetical protein RJA36_2066 [Pseudomonadota bacterium]|jgi:glycerophosphoryl diester phosphodiesterase